MDVGLAADIGTLQRFPKVTGNESKARELAMTGRKFDAVEAKDIGFVSEVVRGGRGEVLGESALLAFGPGGPRINGPARALDLAGVIASKSPVAVVSTKHLMNRKSFRVTFSDWSVMKR